MGFSRQEYWSGLPFPSAGDLPQSGIKPKSSALQVDYLPSEPLGKALYINSFLALCERVCVCVCVCVSFLMLGLFFCGRGGEGGDWVGRGMCVVLLSSCSSLASHSSDFSCFRAQALGAGASVGLWANSRAWAQCSAEARGLSCFMACGIFPDQGLNPAFLHW